MGRFFFCSVRSLTTALWAAIESQPPVLIGEPLAVNCQRLAVDCHFVCGHWRKLVGYHQLPTCDHRLLSVQCQLLFGGRQLQWVTPIPK